MFHMPGLVPAVMGKRGRNASILAQHMIGLSLHLSILAEIPNV